MPESARWLRRATASCTRVAARLREIGRGATGVDAYANYLEHHLAHHPETPPKSREAFFRANLVSRWEGVRRCC